MMPKVHPYTHPRARSKPPLTITERIRLAKKRGGGPCAALRKKPWPITNRTRLYSAAEVGWWTGLAPSTLRAQLRRAGHDAFNFLDLVDLVEPMGLGEVSRVKGKPERWWPMGKRGLVWVGPGWSWTSPCAGMRVSTDQMRQAVEVEGSVEAVVHCYEWPTACVRAALRFEERCDRMERERKERGR